MLLLPGLLLLLASTPSVQDPPPGAVQQLLVGLEARNAEIEAAITISKAAQTRAEEARASVVRETTALLDRADTLEERLASVGRTRATGILMRRTYDALRGVAELRGAARARQDRIGEVDLRLVLQETELERLADLDAEAARLLAGTGWRAPTPEAAADATAAVRQRLEARAALLGRGLIPADNLLRDRLLEEDEASRALAALSERLRASIRGQLVWVRSSPGDEPVSTAAARLLSPSAWSATVGHAAGAGSALLQPIALALLALLLFALRRRLRARVILAGQRVGRYRTDSTLETLMVAAAELLRAAPVPLLLVTSAWFLELGGEDGVGGAASHGLREAAAMLLPLVWLHHACFQDGLARRHFRWSKDGALRRGLRWLTPFAVISTGAVAALDHTDAGMHTGGVARVAFVAGQLALAVFLHRTMAPTGPLLQPTLKENPNGWLARTRLLWSPLRVALPLAAAALAATDWTFGAEVLATGVRRTLVLAAVVAGATAILHRWRRVERRRIAVTEALRRQEARRREAEESGGSAADVAAVEEDTVDLPAIDAQTRQLFRTSTVLAGFLGLYSIWSVALPVLGVLDRVEIWPTPRIVDERIELLPAPASALVAPAADSTDPRRDPAAPPRSAVPSSSLKILESAMASEGIEHDPSVVTLQQIFVGLLFLLGTFVVVRNLTGLLEILLLRMTKMPADSRLATSSLARYTLSVIGMALAFRAVGIEWSQVQWLAAALTFGLAFGLQEIFANFVSGLIILLERPVRIGDTVTVGDLTGTVSRIRTRATTITDWDRKELLVPNKSFITDQVVNWSLSDPVLRVTTEVGVAYASDAEQVSRLLLEAAAKTANVLADPPPRAVFAGFGDNALQFKLRTFIPQIEFMFDVRSDLHHAILREFRAAGIEIPFPQRDLHIRSWSPEVVVRRSDDRPPAAGA